MPQFTVNTTRFDPYKNFKFRIKWDGRYVAGVSKVSPLKRATEAVSHAKAAASAARAVAEHVEVRSGDHRTRYHPRHGLRGVDEPRQQHDRRPRHGAQGIPQGHHDRTAQRAGLGRQGLQRVPLFRVGVHGAARLDANAHVVAIEKIVLQNEGWERDVAVNEPAEV